MVGAAGLEPATLCLEGRCSIQLSYAPTLLTFQSRFGNRVFTTVVRFAMLWDVPTLHRLGFWQIPAHVVAVRSMSARAALRRVGRLCQTPRVHDIVTVETERVFQSVLSDLWATNRVEGLIIVSMSIRPPHVEPRWPVLIALSSVVALNFALPEMLSVGPRWLLAVVFVVLATAAMIFHSRR